MRLDYQVLLKSPPSLTLLAGSAHGQHGAYTALTHTHFAKKQLTFQGDSHIISSFSGKHLH